MWPTHDPDVKPGINDGGFTQWARKGLSALCLHMSTVYGFKTLSDRYGLL